MRFQQRVFAHLYRRAETVETLPWHREEPPRLLEQAAAQRAAPARALDLGCGQGVYAAYLAQHGFSVTGIDFVPAALAAASQRAEASGVEIELRECDVIDFEADSPFDLVLDSGCLHHLPKRDITRYRARLDEWLAPGGDYVLVHFAHRPRMLWVPNGPRHMTRHATEALFASLELRAFDETSFDVPLPMGRMRAGIYWFKRPSH